MNELIKKLKLPDFALETLKSCRSVSLASSIDDLHELSIEGEKDGEKIVSYDIPGKGEVKEALVSRVKNGISANYFDSYMRRRDPNSMLIGDDLPTDKPSYSEFTGNDFAELKNETLEWLKSQDLAAFVFRAGQMDMGFYGIAIAPANAGFFCLGLGLLQGIVDWKELEDGTEINIAIYTAPPFRHTHFDGRQVVVHERTRKTHEIFSYNLYPGPSAKKGVYSALIDFGEKENWITTHSSVVQVVTPYENRVTIMHEGASGGGKSEMHEHIHREYDGTITLGKNVLSGDHLSLVLPRGCDLKPVADDMAVCHPSIQKKDGTLRVIDAEAGWFIRVDHIKNYGTDPDIEALAIHPEKPLLFLNMDAPANSTALVWEHTEDEPGIPCPNPRFVVPRDIVPGIVSHPVNVNIRSFGVRTPPCHRDEPTYGIMGLFHVIPPALAWLWRLVSPRGYANPSIIDTGAMSSEGVGSYWPFATGKKISQANLLLKQIENTGKVHYVLCPNQHIGAWKVGFNPQWIMREYLARRGGVKFMHHELSEARSPLLGYSLNRLVIEGQEIEKYLLMPELQNEVGLETYDIGAKILSDFFSQELQQYYNDPDLCTLGKKIIECFMNGGTVNDYDALIEAESVYCES
ncbi:MAG: DUF4914 family protein [Spirochaetes bacterium]|jgi:hypothetical protein|nr:DUF4914 family protein [Spirochaetota bacterium]